MKLKSDMYACKLHTEQDTNVGHNVMDGLLIVLTSVAIALWLKQI